MSKKNNEKSLVIESAIKQFGLIPNVKLSKKDRQILEAIYASQNSLDFYNLCEFFDMKPSKLDKKINNFLDYGLLDYSEDDEDKYFKPNAMGEKYLNAKKKDIKAENKFRKFIKSMNENELKDFIKICDEFDYVEEIVDDIVEENIQDSIKEEDAPQTLEQIDIQ